MMSGTWKKTSMGRPREFDTDTAIRGAMEIFWRQGYKATNLPDLLDAMGLTRGSFYKAFGDKESVYLATLDHYGREVISAGETMLASCNDATASDCLSRLFDAATDAKKGCFLCNAIVELGADNADVAERCSLMTGRLRNAIRGVLVRYDASATPDTTADLILHLYFGYQALGKAGGMRADWKRHLDDLIARAA